MIQLVCCVETSEPSTSKCIATNKGDITGPHASGTVLIGLPHALENESTCFLSKGGGLYRSLLEVGKPTTSGWH
jgi:hypothetical protein